MSSITLIRPDHWTSETLSTLMLMKGSAKALYDGEIEILNRVEEAFTRMTDLITYAVIHDLKDPLGANVAACEEVKL